MRTGLLAVAALLGAGALQAASLQVQADDEDVQRLLIAQLDLARALAQAEREPLDDFERQRLCALASEQVRQLLQIEGYFAPRRIALDCAALRLQVEVGEIARFRNVLLEVEGPQDAAQLALWRQWLWETRMRTGRAFVRERWSDGKSALLARVRAQGYPLAQWAHTQAEVDAQTQQVDVQLRLAPGVAARIGPVTLEGLRHHDERRTRQMLGLQEGEVASEAALLAAQTRLLKSQLFDSAQVELDTDSLQGDRMTVRVRLREAPLQQLGLGLGWTTQNGGRITVEHQHRRPYDLPLRTRTRLAWAQDAQALEGELSTHPGARQQRWLTLLRWEREEGIEAPYRQLSWRAGQVRETPQHDRALAVELLNSHQGSGLSAVRSDAWLLHANPAWRQVDSVLLPSDGQTLALQSAVGKARSRDALGTRRNGSLARLQLRWQGWRPLEDERALLWRVELGQLWAADALGLPESLRFRAGGDGSVRGYTHRSLGPRGSASLGSPEIGGRVLWAASLEAVQPLPAWFGIEGLGLAGFVDAGQAAQAWREAKPAYGLGLGLRWRSPVGLLRTDLAKGQRSQGGGWRLHIAVGIAL